jgi:hypothetical protein
MAAGADNKELVVEIAPTFWDAEPSELLTETISTDREAIVAAIINNE